MSLSLSPRSGEVITNSLRKSCSLYLIPNHLLHECFDLMIPVISQIINQSLLTGTVHLSGEWLLVSLQHYISSHLISHLPLRLALCLLIIGNCAWPCFPTSACLRHHTVEGHCSGSYTENIKPVTL